VTQTTPAGRVRAFGYFVIAGVYFLFAEVVSGHAASGLVSGEWHEFAERTILLFLLLIGYGAMGRAFQHQPKPLAAMGLVFRGGWRREFGLGAALGWGMLIVSILPLVLTGGLMVTVWLSPHQLFLLVIDVLLLAVASLGEEIAFRGYPFQRLMDAMGPFLATLVLSALFGMAHMFNPDASRPSVMVAIFAGWLLSAAYLRTRALWMGWGWHFAWNASMGLIFGLPVSGITRFSPVIQSNTIGPLWITGGEYGPEASTVTAVVMLLGVIVLFRITRDYAYKHAQPVIVAAGMPVDLDAMSSALAPHHPAAATSAETTLVQIESVGRDPAISPPFRGAPWETHSASGPADQPDDSPLPPGPRHADQ
jgi:uncharacterized protein